MKLVTMLAKSCNYAQEHIDDGDAWDTSAGAREYLLQCVSYQMACFLAQNTVDGNDGVDWDIVITELSEHPKKTEKQWEKILNDKAKEYGGWVKNK